MTNPEKCFDSLIQKGIEILSDYNSRFTASVDNSRYSFLPCAVAKVKNAEEVASVLKFANENKIQVNVRGAGSGCSGGALPFDNALVLDVSEINFIEIDKISWIAHVGAGAVNAKIDEKANEYGLAYPPDPSSKNYSTIGGNIACNAGGLRAAKYGTTRDYVLALKVCTPTGEILNLSRPIKKFASGLNLKDLFIGSEGTLGVIVEAWLKLVKKPNVRKTYLAFFESDYDAFSCVQKILASSIMPSVLEFMDADSVFCAAKFTKVEIEKASMLLIELDGSQSEVDENAEKLQRILSENSANFRIAKDEAESEQLWEMRRACSPAMFLMNNTKINQDVVLPIDRTSEFFQYFKSLESEFDVKPTAFGHAADGNYHIHFMYDINDPAQKQNAEKAIQSAILKAIELGGAVSGEHGIGILKTKYLPYQLQNPQIELMKSIKKVFDPNNILNSKVLFSKIDFSPYSPLKDLVLPWQKSK